MAATRRLAPDVAGFRTWVASGRGWLPDMGDLVVTPAQGKQRPSAVEIARVVQRPDPTPEQIAVIEAPLGPHLVVAGAGSGKTETMASRVVWLIVGGDVAPDEVLGLTFTRKAAGELAERIRGRLRALRRAGRWAPQADAADVAVPVSTYHAYAGRLVRDHGLRLGVEPEARLLTEAACWQLATQVVERWSGDMDAVDLAPSTVTQAVLTLAGEVSEHLVDLDDLDDYLRDRITAIQRLPYDESSTSTRAPIGGATSGGKRYAEITTLLGRLAARRQLIPIVRAYQQLKREQSSVDFGDQLALAARLAEAPDVRQAERRQARAVLLDEFQDTSHAQLVMLRRLFDDGHPVTAVGDPHQSIYGWRGAGADALAAFTRHFPAVEDGPTPVRHLATSWRNSRAVLGVANVLAGPLRERTVVPVTQLASRPGAEPGAVEVATLTTADQEADAVVDWIARRWWDPGGGHPVVVDGRSRSAAVLCRRRAQFPVLEAALLRRGLPYQVVGLGGLLSTPEVADLLAALHVVADPTRGDLLMRLLTGPSCRLGAHDLMVLGSWSRELCRRHLTDGRTSPTETHDEDAQASLVEALDELPDVGWRDGDGRQLSGPARRRLERLADTVRGLRGRTALPLPELVVEVEQALLLDVELASRPGVSPAQARAHLDAIGEVASRFAASAEHATLPAFLSWLQAADEQEHGLEPGQVEVDEQVVQVMTVHAAKGLEWDVVAVPGMVEGVFPQHRSLSRAGADPGSPPPVSARGWLGDVGALPHALRGDRAALPDVRWSAASDQRALRAQLEAFRAAAGEHLLAEERRLAYVACTRARVSLLLTGHVWGSTKTPRQLSRFVAEVAPGVVTDEAPGADVPWVIQVTRLPGADERHPEPPTTGATWPDDPLGDRRPRVEEAARLVRRAMADQARADQPTTRHPVTSGGQRQLVLPSAALLEASATGVDDHLIDLLLAERDRQSADAHVTEVVLPTHLSASRLVQLHADPDGLALAVRRPVPRAPAVAARRGTAFHAWVEHHLSGGSILDVLDLPGAADEDPAADDELSRLVDGFLATEWAHRRVLAVEVTLETPVDGTMIRGRVDAVFARDADPSVTASGAGAGEDAAGKDAAGVGAAGVDVVDWKTGAVPTGAVARAQAVQLAAYRLAWHRLHGTPLDRIGAAFVYVAHGRTVRPVDLHDEAGLIALLRQAEQVSEQV
ncbi:MAG: UvrD-helicase domain-containing protein [Angustibacter sp.]